MKISFTRKRFWLAIFITLSFSSLVFGDSLTEKVDEFEKKNIVKALEKTKGSITEAAKILRMPRKTLEYKIGKYGIKRQHQEN